MAFEKNVSPIAGDLLRVHRKDGYYHFGIAVAPDRVVHFTAEKTDLSNDSREFKIIETSLERFLLGDTIEIETPYSSPFKREDVVKRARNYANSHCFRGKPYNFVTNNCEHFARYCYSDERTSKQVVEGAVLVGAVATGLVATAAASAISFARKKLKRRSDK